jgi:fibrillarin-like rRNA methylase
MKLEYRVWNPFRSKLAAAILGMVCFIYMAVTVCVVYLQTISAELQSQIKILTKTKSHMYIDVTS